MYTVNLNSPCKTVILVVLRHFAKAVPVLCKNGVNLRGV